MYLLALTWSNCATLSNMFLRTVSVCVVTSIDFPETQEFRFLLSMMPFSNGSLVLSRRVLTLGVSDLAGMEAAQDLNLAADTYNLDFMSRDGSESSVESTPLGAVAGADEAGKCDVRTVGTLYDSNRSIHESHTALLYLLSHPEEFQRALEDSPAEHTKSLEEWNNEAERDSLASASVCTRAEEDHRNCVSTRPLPFLVFSDDAEVVLPQAHTPSQLFGSELIEGIELEAAAGIRSLSQLFLRWLGNCFLRALDLIANNQSGRLWVSLTECDFYTQRSCLVAIMST